MFTFNFICYLFIIREEMTYALPEFIWLIDCRFAVLAISVGHVIEHMLC